MTSAAETEEPAPDETALRRDLAACYRLVALFGWDDLIATHISVRVPGTNTFLINPLGMLFDEIRPRDLVKVDMEGNILSDTTWPINMPGFVIHSAIHRVRHDVICAMHLHTVDGVAVSTLEEGLLPISQTSLVVANDIAYHEYEGAAFRLDERERLAADLGDKHLMILRNHGTLALGASVAQAFVAMYYLETACSMQIRAQGTGKPIHPIRQEVVETFVQASDPASGEFTEKLVWPAMLRKLERVDPGWMDR